MTYTSPVGGPASERLTEAARIVSGWPEPYAGPLEELLQHEAQHAAALERESGAIGWERYPAGALLARLADAVIVDEDAQRLRRGRRP
jgi:hypothetical protein